MSNRDMRRKITVCDTCLQRGCWEGTFMCEDALTAGTVDLPEATVYALDALPAAYSKLPAELIRSAKAATGGIDPSARPK